MSGLTARQQRVLDFLREFIDERGYPPSFRDIGRACGITSTSVVDFNLRALERGGYLRRDPDVSRGIELAERGRARVRRVPLLGQIAAGEPIPVPAADSWLTHDPNEMLEITEDMAGSRHEVYALRVKGTSMIDALINDGDIVLLQPARTAENGEMVAAWLKNEKETTLKRFYREDGRVRLQPANSQMQPIYAEAENVEVQGKVIGVIRQV